MICFVILCSSRFAKPRKCLADQFVFLIADCKQNANCLGIDINSLTKHLLVCSVVHLISHGRIQGGGGGGLWGLNNDIHNFIYCSTCYLI